MNDLLKPNIKNAQNLIWNSPEVYPLCTTEEEANIYLSMLLNPQFYYTNAFSFDLTDYEKLFYLEQKFQNSKDIQDKLKIIKHRIADTYEYKQKYLYRISDCLIDIDNIDREPYAGYLDLPEELFIVK